MVVTIAMEQIAQSVVTVDGWRGSENCWGVKRGRTLVGSCNHQCGESVNINGVLVKACQALNWTIQEFEVNLVSDEPHPRQIPRYGFFLVAEHYIHHSLDAIAFTICKSSN